MGPEGSHGPLKPYGPFSLSQSVASKSIRGFLVFPWLLGPSVASLLNTRQRDAAEISSCLLGGDALWAPLGPYEGP